MSSDIAGDGYGSAHRWKEVRRFVCLEEKAPLNYIDYKCSECGAGFRLAPYGRDVFETIKSSGTTNWCPDPNVLRPQTDALPAGGVHLMSADPDCATHPCTLEPHKEVQLGNIMERQRQLFAQEIKGIPPPEQ